MAHGIIATVPAPIDMYRAVNAKVNERLDDEQPDGLAVHITRATADGFQVIEVWESKKQCDDFQDNVLAGIIDDVSGGQAPPREDVTEEFVVENFFTGPALGQVSSK
ncbi:MAG TPA: hypothetical protein VJ831_02890 [Jatrophihabitantaceae bacterium]|nr:hypothetical protein [Jatrophihabitantaceae bacterium]